MSDVTWIDEGVFEGGVSFGDDQVSDDVSRRYVRQLADGTWQVVTSAYAVIGKEDGESGPYRVDNRVEYVLCRDKDDPGSTEIWSEYQDGEGSHLNYETVEEAKDEAMNLVWLEDASMVWWNA
jgi:hypothetical protein